MRSERLLPGTVAPPTEVDSEGIDLRQYLHSLRKRRLAILLTCLTVVAAVVGGSFIMRPVYRSMATIQIERENPNILSFQEIQVIDKRQDDFYQTHNMLLQSRNLARRVVDALALDANPEFVTEEELAEGAVPSLLVIERLQERLMVQPVRSSRLFRIGIEARDPELATNIANTVADSYIDMHLEAKFEATQAATEFLSSQIDKLKFEIEDKKRALQEYVKDSQILSIDDDQNITVQTLTALNSALTEAQAERMESESANRALKNALRRNGNVDNPAARAIPDVANNHLVQTLQSSHAKLQSRYVELGRKFRDDWPEMRRLRDQLDDLDRQVLEAEDRILNGLLKKAESDYRAALGRETLLRNQLEKQRDTVSAMNRSAINFNTLKADIDNKTALLASLAKRKNETDVAARLKGLKSSNVRIVDRAEPPLEPVRPNKKLNAVLGTALGLILGIAVAFFLEFFDNTIKSVDDVERYTGLPSFGVIPLFSSGAPQRALGRGADSPPRGRAASAQLVTLRDARSAVSEAYRALRTSLLMSAPGSAPRSLLITSSQPGEGKTTTVVNTAIALAQAGKQVLLIDADLRKPRCHRLLGLHNKLGLSSFLTGNQNLKDLVQSTTVRNLFVLTSGPIPPNPSELLGSERMTELLKAVPPGVQHVLLDSPPVLSVTDSTLVATMVDGVVLVVRAGTTPRQLLLRTQKRILDVNAKIMGVVLNSVDEKNADYYYSYSGYTYGDEKAS